MKSFFFPALFFLSAALLAAQNTSDPAPVPVEQEPHHRTVLKNEYVLVMHVTLPEGERSLYHIHDHDRVSVELSSASVSQQKWHEPEGQSGPSKPGDISAPTVGASPLVHRIHNFGPGNFEVVDIELLQKPRQPSDSTARPVAAENPSARVYKWALAPGATSPMHTHNRPYLILAVTKMPLKMTAPDGQSSSHEIQSGDFHWVDQKVTHSLTNEGTTEGQIVEVELK